MSKILDALAAAPDDTHLVGILSVVDKITHGELSPNSPPPIEGYTFKRLGDEWTSGALAKHPRHGIYIKSKKTNRKDQRILERWVYPVVGENLPVTEVTDEHRWMVLERLPDTYSDSTKYQVGQAMRRVLQIAVKLKLIPSNPIPSGTLPKGPPPDDVAKSFLYPREEAQLLACAEVPLCWRVFYGFLHREGLRCQDAASITRASGIDFENGGILTVRHMKNQRKQDRFLDAGTVRMLQAWIAFREGTSGAPLAPNAPIFVDELGRPIKERHNSARFRAHVLTAGIGRDDLFKREKGKQLWLRLHDTRATFVVTALANDRSDRWIMVRTGHKTRNMIATYDRSVDLVKAMEQRDLVPLDRAIPELAAYLPEEASKINSKIDSKITSAGDPINR